MALNFSYRQMKPCASSIDAPSPLTSNIQVKSYSMVKYVTYSFCLEIKYPSQSLLAIALLDWLHVYEGLSNAKCRLDEHNQNSNNKKENFISYSKNILAAGISNLKSKQ